jgi:hypothetical protein
MGYTTDFMGAFLLDKPLSPEHYAYLKAFNETRRMRRDAEKTKLRPDPIREAVGLPVGPEGSYFVGEGGFMGQDNGSDVIEHNDAPGQRGYDWTKSPSKIEPEPWAQPGLWCKWVPNQDGTAIEWDGAEKFYDYVEWITYLIEHFLEPWGYKLTGNVEWQGEEDEDVGVICIRNNRVRTGQPSDLELLVEETVSCDYCDGSYVFSAERVTCPSCGASKPTWGAA